MQFIAHRPEGWSAIPASFFGFFVLGARPLIIEPCEPGNSTRHIGGEYAIAVFRSVEQRILLGLVVLRQTVFLLLIPQSEETMLFAPALRAYRNSHCPSASVFGDPVQSAAFNSSIRREVLRAEMRNFAPAFSYASTASAQ